MDPSELGWHWGDTLNCVYTLCTLLSTHARTFLYTHAWLYACSNKRMDGYTHIPTHACNMHVHTNACCAHVPIHACCTHVPIRVLYACSNTGVLSRVPAHECCLHVPMRALLYAAFYSRLHCRLHFPTHACTAVRMSLHACTLLYVCSYVRVLYACSYTLVLHACSSTRVHGCTQQ